ncbi:Nitroreductase family protein [Roseovarius albus]|uniref:Nitroreductase family protein n=1 Tax=Roseovarius albus TaxID=1247867 RepID=A0A1X7A478_9RHOB|nr:SagB/ThcOx family dehydrogenase [Roseovarius albus]SLN70233.1 Nitroreductase family protein [Roseovarius albus]
MQKNIESKAHFDEHPLSWTFHRNTCRWAHNAQESSGSDDVPEPGAEYPDLPYTPLPEPQAIKEKFDDLINRRCSCRDFSDAPISQDAIATILHYGYGILGTDHWGTAEFLERPVPSGGGMYPLELYLLTRRVTNLEDGIYHYAPLSHGLEQVRAVTLPDPLIRYLFMGQYPVLTAAAIVIISAAPGRSMKKYGDRGYRYMLFEAGHIAQNMNLAACALGLETLNLGGFFDDEINRLCGAKRDEQLPLYAVAIGRGVSNSKHRLRFSE